ncbi:MAG: hypothetical protein JNJ42_12225 [Burkholderiaceae bacterium]|jgi:hypothetical protein|nr:hypothetical protein [Burkholderiaceae bacterium]
MPIFIRPGRVLDLLALAASSLLLAGCGGGIYLGLGWGDDLDLPPSVALTASVTEALPGATVRLAAAATDDFGIDQVIFLRREDDGSDTSIGSDGAEPYSLDIAIPAVPAGTVLRYYAQAVDGAQQRSNSELVSITVR